MFERSWEKQNRHILKQFHLSKDSIPLKTNVKYFAQHYSLQQHLELTFQIFKNQKPTFEIQQATSLPAKSDKQLRNATGMQPAAMTKFPT